jgi:restriction system protein
MPIWEYSDHLTAGDLELLRGRTCVFCGSPMETLPGIGAASYTNPNQEHYDVINGRVVPAERILSAEDTGKVITVCRVCGWWTAQRSETWWKPETVLGWTGYGAVGVLKRLSLTDLSTPIEEVRAYLAARYEDRLRVDPHLFEAAVADVFRDLGYVVRATGHSGDDGIDAVLDGPEDTTVGLQVKRWKNRISVAQIREFTGALFMGGYTHGIFVAASEYQSGCPRTAHMSTFRGIAVRLLDARAFYDALCIAQRNHYAAADDADGPWSDMELHVIGGGEAPVT